MFHNAPKDLSSIETALDVNAKGSICICGSCMQQTGASGAFTQQVLTATAFHRLWSRHWRRCWRRRPGQALVPSRFAGFELLCSAHTPSPASPSRRQSKAKKMSPTSAVWLQLAMAKQAAFVFDQAVGSDCYFLCCPIAPARWLVYFIAWEYDHATKQECWTD